MSNRSLLAGAGVAAIALVGLGWLDQNEPRAEPRPALFVTVDNARSAVHTGDLVTYTTRVRNLDSSAREVVVTQMLPAALRVVSTAPSGSFDTKQIAWTVDVAPGAVRTLTAKGRVTESRHGYPRLSTSSCVGVAEDPNLACSSDSDRLSMPAAAAGRGGGGALLIGGLALGMLSGGIAVGQIGRESATLSIRALWPLSLGEPGPPRLPRWAAAMVRPAGRPRLAGQPGSSAARWLAVVPNVPRRLGNARDPPGARPPARDDLAVVMH